MPFAEFRDASFMVEHATDGTVVLTLRVATEADGAVWEREWRPRLEAAHQDGADWPWVEHLKRSSTSPDFLCLAICRGAKLEAMMSLSIEIGGSRLAPKSDTVYVEYVGVAPDNLGAPIGTRAIRGLGGVLLAKALRLSANVGLMGRLGLHSKQAVEDFYRHLGFTECGYEETEDGSWLYFEMTPDNVEKSLEEQHGD